MITDHRLVQSLNNLATAAKDSHPEVAVVLLTLAGLIQRPNKIELKELFTAAYHVAEREVAAMNREDSALHN